MFLTTVQTFLYQKIVRPLLFCLDAERAHELTLSFLNHTQRTPLKSLYRSPRLSDPVELLGLRFPNKVGLAAGLDKNALCIDAFDAMGFGFVEVGTVTPEPQAGNPKPRMFRLPAKRALINRLGFNNLGTQTFIQNVQRASCRLLPTSYESTSGHGKTSPHPRPTNAPMLVGLNIGKNASTPIEHAAQDYVSALRAVYPFADYVTVNISSPNTKNLRSLQSDEALHSLLSAIESARVKLQENHSKHVPLFLKIAPDLDSEQMQVIANTLTALTQNSATPLHSTTLSDEPNAAKSWGLIATNTTLSRQAVQGLAHASEQGGLSGGPVFEQSNYVIRTMRSLLGPEFVIIGVGGVCSAEDAVEKLKAGADLVQIYTGLIYKGPTLVGEIARGLKEFKKY